MNKKNILIKKCIFCNKKLNRTNNEIISNWKKRKYCNSECFYKSRRKKEIKCELCSNLFWPRSYKQRFCSKKCSISWRECQYKTGKIKRNKLKPCYGSDNINWKGGSTKLNERIRKSIKYKDWRKIVFRNNDYICQGCNIKGGDLEAHHKVEFSKLIEDNNIKNLKNALNCKKLWDTNNGTTLCVKCHRKTFKFYKNQYVKK